jgi:hypothetical protein
VLAFRLKTPEIAGSLPGETKDGRPAHDFAVRETTLMKAIGFISTTALLLLLGATIPVLAQEEQHGQEAKPEKQEQAKPEQQEKQAKPAEQKQSEAGKQEKQAKPAEQKQSEAGKQEKQAKPAEQKQSEAGKQEKQAKPAEQKQSEAGKQENQNRQVKQEEPAKNAGQQHAQRSQAEEQRQRAVPELRLSARGNGRIPDDRFRSNFGGGHTFVINEPTIVGGYSRFQYGGFWFGFVEPWPMGWYYTDQVYVDYIDGGYYLCNPLYPSVRVAISVVE